MSSYAINDVVSSHKVPHCTILSVLFICKKIFIKYGSFQHDLVNQDGNPLLTKLEDEPQELGFNGVELRFRSTMEGASLSVLCILKEIELFLPAEILSVANASHF